MDPLLVTGVPGIYPVTIDAIDDSIPTQTATTSFMVDIQQQTLCPPFPVAASRAGRRVDSDPSRHHLHGRPCPWRATRCVHVNVNGTMTPLGIATTNAMGLRASAA